MNWLVWEVIISDIIPDGLSEVRRWTFRDLVEAHAVIRAVSEMREHARTKAAHHG